MKKLKIMLGVVLSIILMLTSSVTPTATSYAAVTATKSVTLNVKSKVTMYVGTTKKIKVKSVTPKRSSKKVTYKSSKPSVVKVTKGGTVKALKVGKATITVTSATNKKVSKKIKVTVKNLVKNRTNNKMVIALDKKVKKKKLSRVSKVKASYLKFTSSKKSVATVSKKGVIIVKKPGVAKITIKGKKGDVKGAKQTLTVYVAKKAVKNIKLNAKNIKLHKSETYQLQATILPKDSCEEVFYASSDESVASVSEDGKVTAVGTGRATIKATTLDGNKIAKCIVTVEKEATATATPKATATATPEVTATATPEATVTATPEATATATPVATVTEIPVNLTTQDMYEKVPYVSTYYFEPKPDYREDVVIPIYITDYEQSEYLKNDTTKTIDLLYEVDGEEHYLRNIKLGDMEVNLGKLTVGEHYFALQAIDRTTGLKSHKLYNDLLVVDPEEEKITEEQTYQITDADLSKYGISKQNSTEETDLINTRDGLTNLFKEIQEKGYRKCILPMGTYRIKSTSRLEAIFIPSYLTVDMNGATFKLHTVADNEDELGVLLVSFNDVEDAHLINGILEGDRIERKELGLENGYNGEPIDTLAFNGGKYCSIDDLIIKNTTGHTIITSGIGGKWAGFTEYTPVRVVDGEEVSDDSCCTTNYADLTKIKECSAYARVGQGNGYRGLRGESPIIYVHFYDANKNFIKTETAYQYRNIRIPEEAKYGRVTYFGKVDSSDKYNSFYEKTFGDFHEITNIDFYDTRTTAMAPSTCSNLLIENVTYTRCGNSITPSSVDFEDGWQECQDVYYRNNTDIENPGSATVIDNTGFNHVYENLKGHQIVIRRSNMGCVVRNIDDIEGTAIRWATGNIDNSKFCRNYNNKVAGCTVSHGNETEELSKHKVKNCVIAKGEKSSIDTVVYDSCTFTGFGGSEMVCTNCTINSTTYLGDQLYFYDCVFEDVTNSTEEMQFRFNLNDATRVYEDCTFKGKSAFISNNAFNSGLFKNCTFEDLRMRVGLCEKSSDTLIEFDNCTIVSSASDFIYLGPYAYTKGYMNLKFNNCNIIHTGDNFIYSYGRATNDSIIEFDNCKINKASGTLITGNGKVGEEDDVTSLDIIFKGGSINKALDISWCKDTTVVRIKYE